MSRRDDLLSRLDAIGRSLAQDDYALALIGLGSAGAELERLDEHSDLDFFVIVEQGQRERYLRSLDWLERVAPIIYQLRNTDDGYKLLFADEIFCEMAVFEPAALREMPFAGGRMVWCQPHVDPALALSARPLPATPVRSAEWLLGEALTNLYVGLGRFLRGEKLSAMRFIQSYALDRALELVGQIEASSTGTPDPFAPERRVEQRFPALAGELPAMLQGYERSPASALALLSFLEARFEVSPVLAERIRALAAAAG